ncbi:MAG: hypothetical protein KDB14_04500 [Planctomycetales bacterium]|nr:hypothetical protein [Planctomycetales bacterium]
MHWVDWLIVVTLNGAVIAVGLLMARAKQTSSEWFLGNRALPWWAIGMSMFATNVDNADIVAVAGSTYNEGLHIISVYAIGSALGGILASFLVVPAIYRRGFYTNAEFLEARFDPYVRLIGAVIQLQYRSSMLGLILVSMHVLLTKLAGIDDAAAWGIVVLAVLFSGSYTAFGGLKSVVFTDALQGIVMMIGGAVIFAAVYHAAGGWSGMSASLEASGRGSLMHIGEYRGKSGMLSPYVIVFGWTILGSGYWTVNHTQTMRLMGARSLWDMKLAATFGVAASLPIMIACAVLGVLGRSLPQYAELAEADHLYPLLANQYLGIGLKGLVVAGVVAAGISTFDSMGSALSAIFTRDIYARFFVKDRKDSHYVLVGRFASVGVLALGFLYLPLILKQENMLKAFTTLVPVLVTPLFTVYVLGVATSASRASGLLALIIGSAYGFVALVDREFVDLTWMPHWLSERWPSLVWSLLVTGATMGVVTLFMGRADTLEKPLQEEGWLSRSREELPPLREHPFAHEPHPLWLKLPAFAAAALMVVCCVVVFHTFW